MKKFSCIYEYILCTFSKSPTVYLSKRKLFNLKSIYIQICDDEIGRRVKMMSRIRV